MKELNVYKDGFGRKEKFIKQEVKNHANYLTIKNSTGK